MGWNVCTGSQGLPKHVVFKMTLVRCTIQDGTCPVELRDFTRNVCTAYPQFARTLEDQSWHTKQWTTATITYSKCNGMPSESSTNQNNLKTNHKLFSEYQNITIKYICL